MKCIINQKKQKTNQKKAVQSREKKKVLKRSMYNIHETRMRCYKNVFLRKRKCSYELK